MNTENRPAAATAYGQSSDRILKLLKRLESGLQTHAIKAGQQPGNWGFTGDVQQLEAKLQELTETFCT